MTAQLVGMSLVSLFAGLVVLDTIRPKARRSRASGRGPKTSPKPAEGKRTSDAS